MPLAQSRTKALGLPSLPIVTVPHPMAVLSQDDVRAIAARAVDEALRQLKQATGEALES